MYLRRTSCNALCVVYFNEAAVVHSFPYDHMKEAGVFRVVSLDCDRMTAAKIFLSSGHVSSLTVKTQMSSSPDPHVVLTTTNH